MRGAWLLRWLVVLATVAVDHAGNVCVIDSGNDTIRKPTPTGVVSTLGGAAGISGSDDGTGASARFRAVSSVATDGAGNLYVAEFNPTARKIMPTGKWTDRT